MKKNPTPSSQEAHTPSESPYLAARREWNERYGDYISAANTWRLIAAFSLALAGIALIGLIWISNQHRIVPFLVETNSFGDISRIARAESPTRPSDIQIRAALRNWIIGARVVYVDFRAERLLNDATYAMTLSGSPAHAMLIDYHRSHEPFERAATESVDVTVNSVVPITDESYRIEWAETTKSRSGNTTPVLKNWQATVTITIDPPEDEAHLMVNPLGIFVKSFAWAQRLNLNDGRHD